MKALLLDTHAFLWWVSDDPRLSERARKAIGDAKTQIYFSAISGFEIAVKAGLGRLPGMTHPETTIPRHLQKNHFHGLELNLAAALGVHQLPNHHSDPFDRLLIAQAIAHKMPLVTRAAQMSAYDIQTVW